MKYRKVIGISAVLIITITIFQRAGNFLVVNEVPIKSDVIVVLAGDNVGRTKFGVQLFKEGFSEHLLFSGATPVANNTKAAESMAEQSMKLGVPREAIVLKDKSVSTYENAIYTKQLVEKKGVVPLLHLKQTTCAQVFFIQQAALC